MASIAVKGLQIGEGMPKTIVSLMGGTLEACLAEMEAAREAGADMVEWRADFASCACNPTRLVEMGKALMSAAGTLPLLFTVRSIGEGGTLDIPDGEYVALNRAIINERAADLVDIELRVGEDIVRELVGGAHDRGIIAVVSYHNFDKTPDTTWMTDLLVRMARLGADIPKIAVMAQDVTDALRLMEAAELAHREADRPLLAIAMGGSGTITRLACEAFGSALTFCALSGSSAPGQVELDKAQKTLRSLHDSLQGA